MACMVMSFSVLAEILREKGYTSTCIGFEGNGGPFNLVQLKIIQECITLTVFALFSIVVFNNHFGWNHLAAFVCLVGAVFFVFYK